MGSVQTEKYGNEAQRVPGWQLDTFNPNFEAQFYQPRLACSSRTPSSLEPHVHCQVPQNQELRTKLRSHALLRLLLPLFSHYRFLPLVLKSVHGVLMLSSKGSNARPTSSKCSPTGNDTLPGFLGEQALPIHTTFR